MDRDLGQQLKEGKTGALKDLYASFFPLLVDQTRQMGMPMTAAADAINQVFLEFWQREGKLNNQDSLSFFQERLSEFKADSAAEDSEEHRLQKELQALPQAEQAMISYLILEGHTFSEASKNFEQKEEAIASLISANMLTFAGGMPGASHPETSSPEPKYQKMVIQYLNEELSLQGEHELRHWVDLETSHSDYFEQMYEVWEDLKALPEAKAPDLEESWQKLERELAKTQLGQRKKKTLNRFSLRMAMILGGVVLALSIAGIWFNRQSRVGQSSLMELPDPDILLREDAYALPPFEEFKKLEEPFILFNVQGQQADTLAVSLAEEGWILESKGKNVLLRNKNEQLFLRNSNTIFYDGSSGSFKTH